MPKTGANAQKRWIFDTVALSNFLLCKAENVLIKRYQNRGSISVQVFTEIEQGIAKGYPLAQIDNFLEQATFTVEMLKQDERPLFTNHLTYLGAGEASCIAMAEKRGYIVVTDDKKVRLTCKELGVPVTGTIGILRACCLDQQLSVTEADEILNNMIANGFFSPVQSISCLI